MAVLKGGAAYAVGEGAVTGLMGSRRDSSLHPQPEGLPRRKRTLPSRAEPFAAYVLHHQFGVAQQGITVASATAGAIHYEFLLAELLVVEVRQSPQLSIREFLPCAACRSGVTAKNAFGGESSSIGAVIDEDIAAKGAIGAARSRSPAPLAKPHVSMATRRSSKRTGYMASFTSTESQTMVPLPEVAS